MSNKGKRNLVEVVDVFPPTGARLVKVHFVWPCFNCHSLVSIDRNTFQQLERKVLIGIKCPSCLVPPKPNLLRFVA